jgi:hypothetical protein
MSVVSQQDRLAGLSDDVELTAELEFIRAA